MEQHTVFTPAELKLFANGYRFVGFRLDNRAILTTSQLNNAQFTDCVVETALIHNNMFKGILVERSSIKETTMDDVIHKFCSFTNTTFKDVNFRDVTFIGCLFNNVRFADCTFNEDCQFFGCYFYDCSFPKLETKRPLELFLNSRFRRCDNIPYVPMTCPDEEGFIGYKKVRIIHGDGEISGLAELYIPKEAARSSSFGRKCRCQFARVISITGATPSTKDKEFEEATSYFDPHFHYRVGSMVYPDSWDENRWDECSNGIHFFMNKQEAIDY